MLIKSFSHSFTLFGDTISHINGLVNKLSVLFPDCTIENKKLKNQKNEEVIKVTHNNSLYSLFVKPSRIDMIVVPKDNSGELSDVLFKLIEDVLIKSLSLLENCKSYRLAYVTNNYLPDTGLTLTKTIASCTSFINAQNVSEYNFRVNSIEPLEGEMCNVIQSINLGTSKHNPQNPNVVVKVLIVGFDINTLQTNLIPRFDETNIMPIFIKMYNTYLMKLDMIESELN